MTNIVSKLFSPIFIMMLLFLILTLLIGINISNSANNVKKDIIEENKEVSKYGWFLIILSGVGLVAAVAFLGMFSKIPGISALIKQFWITIFSVIAILIMMLVIGIIILSIEMNAKFDNESKNDMYSTVGQWMTTITASTIVFTLLI
jgi:hypothetical protein